MSSAPLPEDYRDWPRDPYALLGVSRECEVVEARRAYVRLIRHFKPEHFPEEFRLIREAYDAVRDQAYFRSLEPPSPSASHAPEPLESWSPEAPAREAPPWEAPWEAGPPSPLSGPTDEVRSLWDRACGGDAEGYRRLRQLQQQSLHGGGLSKLLYALLLADPALDPECNPCDWLVEGIPGEGRNGPCRAMYREETRERPAEAVCERFVGLLGRVPFEAAGGLLDWRWEALCRLNRPRHITDDLRRLAPRLRYRDEVGYVRLLLRAADHLAWHARRDFARVWKEAEGFVYVQLTLDHELTRLEMLRELSTEWRKLVWDGSRWSPLVDAVPLLWTGAWDHRHRHRILALCDDAVAKPERALGQLVAIQHEAPAVVPFLAESLASLGPQGRELRHDDCLRRVIAEYLGGLRCEPREGAYEVYRRQILRLCLEEVIAPETVARLTDRERAPFIYSMLCHDWPLRVVCLAHRLIWA